MAEPTRARWSTAAPTTCPLVVKAVLEKVPALDPALVEDVVWGNGQPTGEAGYNIGRVVAILGGIPHVPGVTVNRYCSSSLQTIRMAAHAIKAGEGDVFVAGGVETVSRFMKGMSDGLPGTHNPAFAEAEERTMKRHEGGQGDWTPPSTFPDVYIAMGETAENVAEYTKTTRDEMDEFAALSQNRAVEAQNNGFFEREITAVPLADGTAVSRDDGPRPDTTKEKLAGAQAGVPPRRHDHRGQRVPAERRCGGRHQPVMSETKASELGVTPLALYRCVRSVRARSGDHGPRPDRGEQAGPRARRHDRRPDRPRRDQRGVRRAGDPLGQGARRAVGQAERARRVDHGGATVRHDRRADHDDAPQRLEDRTPGSASRRCTSAAGRAWR